VAIDTTEPVTTIFFILNFLHNFKILIVP